MAATLKTKSMISALQALILGIVEGITEFLPISSTAHLILVGDLLGIDASNFAKSFDIIIQLGAILAVMVLYWKQFLRWEVLKRLVVAFIPTGVIGVLVYQFAKDFLLGNTTLVLSTLFVGGLVLIAFEYWYKEKEQAIEDLAHISYAQCLALGVFQAIAIVPGVSRSAATIVGGLLLGLKRKTIVEFSFLLAVPTMVAATGLDLIKNLDQFTSDQVSSLTIGFICAFITAILAIKLLLAYVRKHTFTAFGIYRVALVLLVVLVGWLVR